MALFFECMQLCAQKLLDAADIVRDGDFSLVIGDASYNSGRMDKQSVQGVKEGNSHGDHCYSLSIQETSHREDLACFRGSCGSR